MLNNEDLDGMDDRQIFGVYAVALGATFNAFALDDDALAKLREPMINAILGKRKPITNSEAGINLPDGAII